VSTPRLIIDVNVILASFGGRRNSLSSQVYTQFRRSNFRLVFDGHYLSEMERVLDYPSLMRLDITPRLAFTLARSLFEFGEHYPQALQYDWPSLSDTKDWYLLNLLFDAKADGIITQDKKVLAAGQKLGMPVFDLQGGAAKG
jgi:predicted nucleic acid-binding protein